MNIAPSILSSVRLLKVNAANQSKSTATITMAMSTVEMLCISKGEIAALVPMMRAMLKMLEPITFPKAN